MFKSIIRFRLFTLGFGTTSTVNNLIIQSFFGESVSWKRPFTQQKKKLVMILPNLVYTWSQLPT